MNETPRDQHFRVSSKGTLQGVFMNLPNAEGNSELVVPDEEGNANEGGWKIVEDIARRNKKIKRDTSIERRELARRSEAIEKLFKTFEPPLPSWLALDRETEMTPFGPIDKHASQKTLYLLLLST